MRRPLLKNNLFLFVLFAIVIFIIFGNALFNDFSYDDHYLILENPYIRSFAFIKEVLVRDVTLATPLQRASGYYRPVSMIYLIGLYQIWGMNSFGLHLMNVLLHLLNTFFVFLIIQDIVKDRRVALLAGLIFAVHPIHVEAVAPIFNYMGLLASFFSFVSFYLFIKSDGMKKTRQAILCLIFFSLGLFSKEEAIVLPFIFVLYDFYFAHQFSLKKIKTAATRYIWFLLPILLYLFLRSQIIEKNAAFGFWDLDLNLNIAPESSPWLMIVSIFRTFANYWVLFIFPFRLSAFYLFDPVSSMGRLEMFLPIFFIVAIFSYGVFFGKKSPFISFSIGFFFISSFLISNVIPIGGLFAERFMYFPSMAYCFIFAVVFFRFFDQFSQGTDRKKRFLLTMLLIVVVVLYAQKTAARNYVWRNNVTLWSDTAQKTPHSMIVRLFLADAYHAHAMYDQALEEYAVVLQYPGAPHARVRNTTGKIYGRRQQYDQAIKEFFQAIEAGPPEAEIYYSLGITYFFKNKMEKAFECFEKAKEIDKNYPWVYYGLGMIYEHQGKKDLSREMYLKTLSLMPQHPMARQALEGLR